MPNAWRKNNHCLHVHVYINVLGLMLRPDLNSQPSTRETSALLIMPQPGYDGDEAISP
jgi:hypothetical protein